MFDAESFLNTDVDGELSTEYVPIPAKEMTGIVKKLDAKEVTSKNDGKTYKFLEVYYICDDQETRDVTGMDEPQVRQSIILDFTPEGGLDRAKGKNVALGKLREACNQNQPGKDWNFNMLIGQAVKISVKHRAGDEGQIYSEVKGVAKL